jgi:hypothetical protein
MNRYSRVHFVEEATRPFSMTRTVYDQTNVRDDLRAQINLIDALFLRQDMDKLLPLTAMYAPTEAWDNLDIQLNQIEEVFLESHLIEKLMWCDRLREIADSTDNRVETMNGQLWVISVNADNFPCFTSRETAEGQSFRSCITECDILARNGIVHVLDTVMMYQTADTRPPSPPTAPIAAPPGGAPTVDNNQPTFGRPPTAQSDGKGEFPIGGSVSTFDDWDNLNVGQVSAFDQTPSSHAHIFHGGMALSLCSLLGILVATALALF